MDCLDYKVHGLKLHFVTCIVLYVIKKKPILLYLTRETPEIVSQWDVLTAVQGTVYSQMSQILH